MTIVTVAAALEAYSVQRKVHDGTFSEFNRWAMRTQTPVGKVAFRLGWAALAVWYFHHITPVQDPRTRRIVRT